MWTKRNTSSSHNQCKLFLLLLALFTTAMFSFDRTVSADDQDTIRYNRDIRPLLSDTCFRCHGPDRNARQAGLRLDLQEEATKKTRSGAFPIVPGRPEESEVIRRIFATEKYEVMPPPDVHKELTAQQKELIRRWVAAGAVYEGHWAWQPVTRPAVPAITALPQAPMQNPIDAFIQARLARAGLQPAPEADRRTLMRRVSLDLTGIPPTPQEVAGFVNDRSPDAYEKLVERLLSSPRYAEKQTMHWLDAVRYADTAGFHGDNAMPTWPYRDYVLRAFRDNKPFDEFTREQLAGDLLPGAGNNLLVASAYNRLNRVSAEGGLQPKEYLAKYAADRVRTTSIVWLGMTMGCAECHDHKFDPLLTKDFYAMKAFFADIRETGLVPDRGRNAFGAKIMLPSAEQRKQYDELKNQLAWLRTELGRQAEQLTAQRASWETQIRQEYEAGELAWRFQRPLSAMATNGTTLTIHNNENLTVTQYLRGTLFTGEMKSEGLIVASGVNPDNETITVTFKPGAGTWTALGLNVVQDESLPANRLARGADRFVITEIEAELGSDTATQRSGAIDRRIARSPLRRVTHSSSHPLSFVLATTDRAGEMPENHPMNAIDGNPQTGWGLSYADGRDAFLALRFAAKVTTSANSVITVRLHQNSSLRKATMGRFRLALSAAEYSWPDHLARTVHPLSLPLRGLPDDVPQALKTAADQRTDAQKQSLQDYFKWAAPELAELNARLARLEAEFDLLDATIPRVLVTEAAMPAETRVLPRGNFLDESGAVVEPAVPTVFGALKTGKRRATRLDLANWLVAPENPLTARVFVNRMWRQFFGTGLSKTLDDLGSQGEWPTHPELLDWLASEFMHPSYCGAPAAGWLSQADCGLKTMPLRHDWDIKHLIRLIVTSHTYRQTSTLPENNPQANDPDNRLLARQNRFRVDAELVRDIALSVSGLLVEQFGGPSVRPWQPEGYLKALNFPQRDYSADRGNDLYRRGLYTQWQRTFLHPSMQAFDAPSREECTVNRQNSNTPLQSLVLLNDPIYVEAARVFAQHTLSAGSKAPASLIAGAFERALSRRPTSEELRVLTDLYRQSLTRFQRDPRAAREFLDAGDAPLPKTLNPASLAALTTVTRAILNLHETITRN